jgi:PAS domain S-box-containing protein
MKFFESYGGTNQMFGKTDVNNDKFMCQDINGNIFSLDFTCFNYMPSAIVVQKDNEIIYVNEVLVNILQCDYEWIYGRSIFELIEEQKEKEVNKTIEEVLSIEDGKYIIRNPIGNEIYVELKCKDEKLGDSIYLFVSLRDISNEKREYEAIKNQKEILTSVRDVSNKKQLEMELHESRELYKSLVDILPIGISIHDTKTFSFVSDTYAKIFGYDSADELIGRTLARIENHEFQKIVDKRLNSLLKHNISLPPMDYRFVTKQGNLIDVEIISARFSHNQKVSIISTVRDITERKKAEENKLLLEKTLAYDRLKSEFFSNMSHELITPLNILLSSLQLIELYVADAKNPKITDIMKYSKVMKQNCYRLLRLINNLLDITKIDSGYYRLDFRHHNIVKIVEDITQSVAAYIKEKNIQIIFDTDVEEKIIGCDEDKIEKVVLSLLSNAVKFTKSGGVIAVTVKDLGDKVKISVKDSGIGIPRDKLNSIFERFIQVDKSLSRITEGAGIGLSLARALIKMHGGTISVRSEYGVFTQFDIILPSKNIEDENSLSNSNQYIDKLIVNKDKYERVNVEFSDIYI